jgi:hypothetical protein
VNTAQCDALALGSLIRGFEPLGFWPEQPDSSKVFMSVSELTAALRDIQIYTYPEDMSEQIVTLKRNWDDYSASSPSDSLNQELRAKAIFQRRIDTMHQKSSMRTHTGCNFKKKFDEDLQKIIRNMPSAVLDSHLRHMEEQSKK